MVSEVYIYIFELFKMSKKSRKCYRYKNSKYKAFISGCTHSKIETNIKKCINI